MPSEPPPSPVSGALQGPGSTVTAAGRKTTGALVVCLWWVGSSSAAAGSYRVLVVAVLKQSPSSLPCHQLISQQPRGCEGRGEQSHVLCLQALIERGLRFLFFRSIEI